MTLLRELHHAAQIAFSNLIKNEDDLELKLNLETDDDNSYIK